MVMTVSVWKFLTSVIAHTIILFEMVSKKNKKVKVNEKR